MKYERNIKKRGFTVVELMLTIAIALMLVGSVGYFIVDSQKSWTRAYERVNHGVTADGLVARKTFETACRKASMRSALVDPDGKFIELYYYQDASSAKLDQYARFYLHGSDLRVDYGSLVSGTFKLSTASRTLPLAQDVKSVNFTVDGAAVRMVLNLDDGNDQVQLTCSSIRHNR